MHLEPEPEPKHLRGESSCYHCPQPLPGLESRSSSLGCSAVALTEQRPPYLQKAKNLVLQAKFAAKLENLNDEINTLRRLNEEAGRENWEPEVDEGA